MTLIGDPGIGGQGRVHVVAQQEYHSHQKMSHVVWSLRNRGLLD